jgi:hypothetical protein
MPISSAITNPAPPASEAPMASDSGIESRPMPSRMPAPPPLCSAITSAMVKTIEPATKAINVMIVPKVFSASITIPKMAAEIKMPAPKAVKNNTCLSLKLTYLAMSAPANEVPPANADIAITRTISIISMLGMVILLATC